MSRRVMTCFILIIFAIGISINVNMKKEDYKKESEPMKVIFNYNNVFFSFFYDDESGCIHRSREYAINYVYSGKMILDNGKQQIHVGKGECVFIPRDHNITMYKKTYDGERYCGIFLSFTRKFLREMYGKIGHHKVPAATSKVEGGVIKLPNTVELTSLFASMIPYFNPEVKPNDDLMSLKLQEGLLVDQRFAPTLFDFNEPWKIDILDFMDKNYMYEFTLDELAHYTGRSLATFKRDFSKISELTPEKWLIRKRLEVAYSKMKEGGKKVVDVCVEVGFKNPSHFSTAFKKQYGIPPTAILD